MQKIDIKKNKGFSIVEILVAIFVIAVALSGLLSLAAFSLKITNTQKETQQASEFAQEIMEAARNFRDGTSWGTNGLGTLSTGFDYHPERAGSPAVWQFALAPEVRDIFSGKIVFDNVFRDPDDNITLSGGTLDNNTKKAIVTVWWKNQKIELVSYFTNWR